MKSLSSQFSFHKVIEIAVEYRLTFRFRDPFDGLSRVGTRLHVTANL